MNTGALTKLNIKTAAEVCARFQLADDARKLLKDGHTPAQFLEVLVAAKQWPDAVRLLAAALPKREAIAWAADCARETLGAQPNPKAVAALKATDAWVKDPSEDNRRAAQVASDQAGLEHPSACAALAVFFSGGSLAPPNVPVVPPGEHLTGHAVAGGVLMAGVATEPEKAEEKYKRFLTHGLDGIGKLEPAKPASATAPVAAAAQPAAAPAAPAGAPEKRPTMGALYGTARRQGQ